MTAKEAEREYKRKWREKNREQIRQYNKKYWERKAAQMEAAAQMDSAGKELTHNAVAEDKTRS